MDLDEKIMMDLVNKSEKIIDDILKNMSFSDYNLLVDEINNLPNNIKEKNKKIMNRVNEIKKKTNNNFEDTNFDDFLKGKEYSNTIQNNVSYFSSGELELLRNI